MTRMSEQQSAGQDAGTEQDVYQVYLRADGVFLLLDPKIQKSNQDDLLKLWSHKSRIFLEYRKTILGSVEAISDESKVAQVAAAYMDWLRAGGFKAQKKEQKLQAKAKKKQAHLEKLREKEDRDQEPVVAAEEVDATERVSGGYKKAISLQEEDDWFYSDEDEEAS